MTTASRRDVLKKAGMFGLGFFATGLGRAAAGILTPPQTEGPFYPVHDQDDKDVDLTLVKGHAQRAKGVVQRVGGKVVGIDGAPLAGAMVEIWQACETGKYNHPDDPNTAALDPDFQYWGRTTTDAQGTYSFLTIKPGAYPADGSWVRPPHIHFKVAAPGFRALTTQMYWEGEALNAKDRILKQLTPEGRKAVTVPFARNAQGIFVGHFEIVIGRQGRREGTPELD